jgi:hypothetical protein
MSVLSKIKTSAFLLFMILCLPVFGQKLTVVIGAVGEEPKPGLRKALETQIKAAFVKDGRFTAVTRDEAVLKMLNKEQAYQRGGAVDDSQIRQIGMQSGSRYVCVVEISPLMESYMLSAQFVDIESAKIITMSSVPSALKNEGDFLAASGELVRQLLNSKTAADKTDGKSGGYGSGIFLEENKTDNPIAAELIKILKQKVSVSDGTCVSGVKISIESGGEPVCSEGMVGITCKVSASLTITQCNGNQKTVLKGSIVGADKYSKETAAKQMMRKAETADFWSAWVNELKTRGGK